MPKIAVRVGRVSEYMQVVEARVFGDIGSPDVAESKYMYQQAMDAMTVAIQENAPTSQVALVNAGVHSLAQFGTAFNPSYEEFMDGQVPTPQADTHLGPRYAREFGDKEAAEGVAFFVRATLANNTRIIGPKRPYGAAVAVTNDNGSILGRASAGMLGKAGGKFDTNPDNAPNAAVNAVQQALAVFGGKAPKFEDRVMNGMEAVRKDGKVTLRVAVNSGVNEADVVTSLAQFMESNGFEDFETQVIHCGLAFGSTTEVQVQTGELARVSHGLDPKYVSFYGAGDKRIENPAVQPIDVMGGFNRTLSLDLKAEEIMAVDSEAEVVQNAGARRLLGVNNPASLPGSNAPGFLGSDLTASGLPAAIPVLAPAVQAITKEMALGLASGSAAELVRDKVRSTLQIKPGMSDSSIEWGIWLADKVVHLALDVATGSYAGAAAKATFTASLRKFNYFDESTIERAGDAVAAAARALRAGPFAALLAGTCSYASGSVTNKACSLYGSSSRKRGPEDMETAGAEGSRSKRQCPGRR